MNDGFNVVWLWWLGLGVLGVVGIIYLVRGIVTIRQTHRGLRERFGKFISYEDPGFHLTFPGISRIEQVNVTEQMVSSQKQEIITKDKLNASVDAQVYFKIKPEAESVKNSQYNVDNCDEQIVALSRTTLRNIIGTLTLEQCNSERGKINEQLNETLSKETTNWGIQIVRTELKEIDPPKDVQETMNKVVKAQNEKVAAIDFATAAETQADGLRRSEIKKAEGIKQARILQAEGVAEAIKLENEAANKYFVGNAQLMKQLESSVAAMKDNSKIILSTDLLDILNKALVLLKSAK